MKKYDVEKVKMALIAKLEAADYGKITITMKCNGDVLVITPCSYDDIHELKDCEYFLVDSPSLPWIGGETIDSIAKDIARYEELVSENENDKKKFAEYVKKYGWRDKENPKYYSDFVSDWHKDIWGYRPRSDSRFAEIIAEYGA